LLSGVISIDQLDHGADGSATSAIPHGQKLERWADDRPSQ